MLIIGVYRRALHPDRVDDADDSYVTDEGTLAALGGLTEYDRLEVKPYHDDGTLSFVHLDPRAIDLDCFAHLKAQ